MNNETEDLMQGVDNPIEVEVHQETMPQKWIVELRKNFKGMALGALLTAPLGVVGGAIYVDHAYSTVFDQVTSAAAEQAIAEDNVQDMAIIQLEIIDPFMTDLNGLGLELAKVKAFLIQRRVVHGQFNADLTEFLDGIDAFDTAEGFSAKYEAGKELYAIGGKTLESIKRLIDSELAVGQELETYITSIDKSFQRLQSHQDTFEPKMQELIKTQGLGEFDQTDQMKFKKNVEDGLREQSGVYSLLHPAEEL